MRARIVVNMTIVNVMIVSMMALATRAIAQPLEPPPEPPPEAPEGVDYVIEPADSLEDGDVELGIGAASRTGGDPVHRRRIRFRGDALRGTVREGSQDPIAGGTLDGRGRFGTFTAGHLSPRWGRGLLLGSAGDPWQREPLDRGPGAAFRGRAGEGVMLRRGTEEGAASLDLLIGRFSRQRLAGLRVRRGALALGTLADGRGEVQSSLALVRGAGAAEVVWDRRGRWRAEGLLERRLSGAADAGAAPEEAVVADNGATRAGAAPDHAAVADSGAGAGPEHDRDSMPRTRAPRREPRREPRDGWIVSGRARGGAEGFGSLAERGRPGPARSLAAGVEGPLGRFRLRTVGALWRFRPGSAGARAALAVERPLSHHGALALGFEEQRGPRRDRGDVTAITSASRAEGLRQGWWGEWWSGTGVLGLGVRHESWGERPWGRGVVRSVTSARVEARGPAELRLAIVHSAFRVRRGESLYLPEAESDRLVLRAVSGEGERTRIELRAPFAGGRARAALHLNTVPERRARSNWTLDWTRKAQLRSRASAAPP